MKENDLSKNNLTEIRYLNNKTQKKFNKKGIKDKSIFYLILFSVFILILIIFILLKYHSSKPNINSSKKIYTTYNNNLLNNNLYVKSDSLLRKNSELTSEIITILIKGTKLIYLNETKEDDMNKIKYDKVKVIKSNLYSDEYIGYINNEQISLDFISEESYLISIESKTKMINEALNLLKSNNLYSTDKHKRRSGFFNYKIDGVYYFDCSSFCSTILNRVFNFTPRKKNSNEKKIWRTRHYVNNITSNNSNFEIVQEINKGGEKLDLNKLQIGDMILGTAKIINERYNHIMLYAGEQYIMHSTKVQFYDKEKNEMRNGIVMQKLNNSNYFTELENYKNIQLGNITKRFDSEIYIIRYKEL